MQKLDSFQCDHEQRRTVKQVCFILYSSSCLPYDTLCASSHDSIFLALVVHANISAEKVHSGGGEIGIYSRADKHFFPLGTVAFHR